VKLDGGAVCVFLESVPFGCCGAGNSGAAAVKRQAVNYPLFLRKGDGGCVPRRPKGHVSCAASLKHTRALPCVLGETPLRDERGTEQPKGGN
jgi:hypothetical protein